MGRTFAEASLTEDSGAIHRPLGGKVRKKPLLLAGLLTIKMMFGVSPLIYWGLLFDGELSLLRLNPSRQGGRFHEQEITGEAKPTIYDRLELSFGLLLSHLLAPVVFGPACFEPNLGVRLSNRDLLVSFDCWGVVCFNSGESDPLWQANIAPVGEFFWQDVSRRHQMPGVP